MLPANIAFVIPNALTLNWSEATSIEELSGFASTVFPDFTKPAPAITCPAPLNCATSKSVVPKVGSPL